MARLAFGVEYDGSNLLGWQSQQKGRSVQGCLQEALSKVADVKRAVRGATIENLESLASALLKCESAESARAVLEEARKEIAEKSLRVRPAV